MEDTITGYGRRLRNLAKSTDINNPGIVKEYITNLTSGNANKVAYCKRL